MPWSQRLAWRLKPGLEGHEIQRGERPPLSCTKPTDFWQATNKKKRGKKRLVCKVSLLISCLLVYKYKCFITFLTELRCSLLQIQYVSPAATHTRTHAHTDRNTRAVLAPVVKQLSEMWQCGAHMLHHCHLPITCIPSPPSPYLHPSAFSDAGIWQGHIRSLVIHQLYRGKGWGGGAVLSQTPSQVATKARLLFVLSLHFCFWEVGFFI